MKTAIGVIVAIIIIGGGWYFYSNQASEPSSQALPKAGDTMEKDGDAMMKKDGFNISASLDNVSGGTSIGDAKAKFEDGTYTLVATFEGLPDPEGTDFYEGWVVRKGAVASVVSTGRVNEEEVGYINYYTSNDNLLDHDFYVLTLEPDDGDPAPAEHILEAIMK